LHRTCNITEAQGKGALDLLHEQILDETNHRDALAFEEDFEETDDNDEEGTVSMSEDCKSEDDSGENE
jgi:hypothetical protein